MENSKKDMLLGGLSNELTELLKMTNAVIAGGAITSVFTKKEINDYDVYFKSESDLRNFLKSDWCRSHYRISSKKAMNFVDWHGNNKLIQVIVLNTYPKIEDIWEDFDFTVCMGAYDFEMDKFFLHNDFIYDNMSRVLNFNKNTAFPIVSLKRVDKYKSRGYSINLSNLYKIAFAIQALEINSLDDVLDNLGGMYGDELDDIFKDILEEDFDINKALDCLDKLDGYEPKDVMSTVGIDYNFIINSRCGHPIFYDKENSVIFDKMLNIQNFGCKSTFLEAAKILNAQEKPLDEFIEFPIKFVKYVNVVGDRYVSFYKNDFEYEEGEIYHDVYVSSIDGISASTYFGSENRAFVYGHINSREDMCYSNSLINSIINKHCILVDRFVVDKIVPVKDGQIFPDGFDINVSVFGNWDFENKEEPKDKTNSIAIIKELDDIFVGGK